ncbi:MAG: hypothetical protein AAGF90_09920, partial [Pseudomonadota bacterium]
SVAAAETGARRVFFGEWVETPLYARDRLPLDFELKGPAILEQMDTTVLIEPGDRARGDAIGNVIVEVGP